MSETFKCPHCDDEFGSERGLRIHIGHKHKSKATEEEQLDLTRVECKCPYCDYTCKGTPGIARHIKRKHPEHAKQVNLTVDKFTLMKILNQAREFIEESCLEDMLPPDVKEQAEECDVKLSLLIRHYALERVERLRRLTSVLMRIDRVIDERATMESLEDMSFSMLMKLQERMEKALRADIDILSEVLDLRLEKGVDLLRSLGELAERTGTGGSVQFTQAIINMLPDSASAREEMRRAVSQRALDGSLGDINPSGQD